MIQNIYLDNKLIAIIIRSHTYQDGIKFVTPNDFSQQIGCMARPQGYSIEPHLHNSVAREVCYTKEVLFIKSGKVRVDFYSDEKAYIESYILNQGDVILLAFGGHGFKMLEDSEILEVKQGPYAGDADKTRFHSVDSNEIKIKQ